MAARGWGQGLAWDPRRGRASNKGQRLEASVGWGGRGEDCAAWLRGPSRPRAGLGQQKCVSSRLWALRV